MEQAMIIKLGDYRLGLEELKTRLLWRDTIVEFMGTLFYIAGHTTLGVAPRLSPGDVPETVEFRTLAAGIATTLLLFVLVDSMLHLSGGFVNPIVPFSLVTTGEMSLIRGVILSVAEVLGSVCGSAFVYGVTPPDWRSTIGPLKLAPGLGSWRGFIFETEQTIVLMVVAFGVLEAAELKTNGTISPGLAIGSAVGLNIIMFGRFTGGCMNPCIVFGPAVVSGKWNDHWVYWVGPFVGCFLATLLYKGVYKKLLSPRGAKLLDTSNVITTPDVEGMMMTDPAKVLTTVKPIGITENTNVTE